MSIEIISELTSKLTDPATPEAERERAYLILAWVKQTQADYGPHESDQCRMFINTRLAALVSGQGRVAKSGDGRLEYQNVA
jgi:hypothetical protein